MDLAQNRYDLSRPDPYTLRTCEPKPLLPLEPPVHQLQLPALPSPPRKSLLDEWFTLSTHLIPAAYPRTIPDVQPPAAPADWATLSSATKKDYARWILDMKAHQWAGQLDALPRSRDQLWLCVNRYVRKGLDGASGRRKGATLFMAHAISLHKETWEPILKRLLTDHKSSAGYEIDEIWLPEAVTHGDSCLLNADKLGGLYDWKDHSRDMLQFLLHYMPSATSTAALPAHLARVPSFETERRKTQGFPERDMMFIGHSFGACTLLRAAIEFPKLFTSLIVLDPVVLEGSGDVDFWFMGAFVVKALQRKSDHWPSREAAYKELAASPFFNAWDPATLKIYVECALYEAAPGDVRTKMPVIHEAIGFADQHLPVETFELLPQLEDRIEVRWIFSGKRHAGRGVMPDEVHRDLRRKTVWRRPTNFSYTFVPHAGHLVPQEGAPEVAAEIHAFLNKKCAPQKAHL